MAYNEDDNTYYVSTCTRRVRCVCDLHLRGSAHLLSLSPSLCPAGDEGLVEEEADETGWFPT